MRTLPHAQQPFFAASGTPNSSSSSGKTWTVVTVILVFAHPMGSASLYISQQGGPIYGMNATLCACENSAAVPLSLLSMCIALSGLIASFATHARLQAMTGQRPYGSMEIISA